MSYQIPLDTIHQLQISLRNEANIPSYDPTEQSFPELPSLEHSISQIDPSPPYLRCKHCKGRLLRGIKSLFCVFCGKEQFGEIPPDPINFRSTTGYRWLLDSLQLDGSEVVEPIPEATDRSSRGQSSPKNERPLSDLLKFEIAWQPKIKKHEDAPNEAPPQPKSSLNLAGVDLDNFFVEGKGEVATLDESEEQLFTKNATNHANESVAFLVQDDLSLFENTQPSTTPVSSKEHESEQSQSSWAVEFQSVSSGAVNEDSRSLDPFAGSPADLSVQMDMVFGSGNTNSSNVVPSSHSNADDWFQDNPTSNTNNSSSVNDDDWFQSNQWQSSSNKSNQGNVVEEKDDSLDDWDDFTSSTGQNNPPNSSTQNESTGVDLFSQAGNAGEIGFGAFQQPDLFSGAFNGAENVNEVRSEASTFDRIFSTDGTKDAKGDGATNATSSKTDIEIIMSQMHDLSFMLDNSLSIPQRSTSSKD